MDWGQFSLALQPQFKCSGGKDAVRTPLSSFTRVIFHTLPGASGRFPWTTAVFFGFPLFLTVSPARCDFFFTAFLLFQVLLPTLYQHTRSRRSCSSLWARSQCLGSTQRCPLQAPGKCLSDGRGSQLLLQCNRSGRLLNKTAAGEM